MSKGPLSSVIEHVRSIAAGQGANEVSDEDLLQRFVRGKDEVAFEALMRRHGPMVLGVCRRVLGRADDVDDAFQVTFLVLIRKASVIRPGEVGNWLYGVACRTAREARRLAIRRRVKEAKAVPPKEAPEDGWTELRPLLDREIARLPHKYRAVIVLCDLEGTGRREAAVRLGVAEGTVASRLARARAALAKKLARYGPAFAGVLAETLPTPGATAGVPPVLAVSTVKAATAVAAGRAAATGAISSKVVVLMKGVMEAMSWTKLKIVATLLVACILGAGVVGMGLTGGAAAPSAAPEVAPPKGDAERLQGAWEQLSAEGKEGKVADEDVKGTTMHVKDDTMTITSSVKKGSYELTFKLDESKKPKEIDEVLIKPEKGDKPYLGIYSLEGDKLTFCFADPGEKRPTEFTAKPGSGWTLTVLRRAKGDGDKPK